MTTDNDRRATIADLMAACDEMARRARAERNPWGRAHREHVDVVDDAPVVDERERDEIGAQVIALDRRSARGA